LENNSREPGNLTENRQSDSLSKSQLTLSYRDDEEEGGVVADDGDDG
jgi:hypothetical protein